jgi:hypothetical protein
MVIKKGKFIFPFFITSLNVFVEILPLCQQISFFIFFFKKISKRARNLPRVKTPTNSKQLQRPLGVVLKQKVSG